MSIFNLYTRYRYGKQFLKAVKNVYDFLITQGLANLILDAHKININSRVVVNDMNIVKKWIDI